MPRNPLIHPEMGVDHRSRQQTLSQLLLSQIRGVDERERAAAPLRRAAGGDPAAASIAKRLRVAGLGATRIGPACGS
jgi:hypothetical protein